MESYQVGLGSPLYHALAAEGFDVPKNCSDLMLAMPFGGIVQLHYTVNIQQEDYSKVERALKKLGIRSPVESMDVGSDVPNGGAA